MGNLIAVISRFLPGRNTVKGVALLLFMLWVVYGFNREPFRQNQPIWMDDFDQWRSNWSDNERKYYSLRGDERDLALWKYRQYLQGVHQMELSDWGGQGH